MDKSKLAGIFFLFFLLNTYEAFGKDEVKDSIRTVTFYVVKDRKNLSEDCEVVLFRHGKQENLKRGLDPLGKPCFFFDAGTREIIRTHITHKTWGEMDVFLKCYWYNFRVEFLQAQEPYYYFFGQKKKLQPDSCLYRVSYGEFEYSDSPLDINDTVLGLMKNTGIPFTKEKPGLFRFNSEKDAVQMEKVLLESKAHIRLEPKIIEDGEYGGRLEKYLSNSSEVFFLEGTTDKQIKKLFRKFGIKTCYKNLPYREEEISYQIVFPHSADRTYMDQLDKLWNRKEVYLIRQSILTQWDYMDYKLGERMPK